MREEGQRWQEEEEVVGRGGFDRVMWEWDGGSVAVKCQLGLNRDNGDADSA